jgi:LPS sulfotransferase NodH
MADVAKWLPPIDPGRPEQPGEFEGWFSYALQRGTSSNGVFGAKMMWNYFDDFRTRVRQLPGLGDVMFSEALDVIFPQLRIIFVWRRYKVAQAVSLWRAIQTQHWRTAIDIDSAHGGPRGEYDYGAIKYLVDELHTWDARWEDWFHATGREPIRVIYEEFRDRSGRYRRPGPRRPRHRPSRARRRERPYETPSRRRFGKLGGAVPSGTSPGRDVTPHRIR